MDLLRPLLSLLAVPLDVTAYLLERVHAYPLALVLSFLLACTPPSLIAHGARAVRAYPLAALGLYSACGVVLFVAWLLFGTLAGALVTTLYWLVWYAPLLWLVSSRLWIVCRRVVFMRLGWRQRVETTAATVRQSIQARLTTALQTALAYAFRWSTAPTETSLPK